MKKNLVLLLASVILLSSCKKNDWHHELTGTFTTNAVKMFGGSIRTWIKTNNGIPQQLAISVDDAAMNSLPADGEAEYETMASLPLQASATPFNHVAVDWNPHGHEPAGVYTFPHFDFHFYMISKDEQMSIPPYEVDSSKFLNFPAPQYLPVNYVPIPGGVPMMGTHWVDVTSPELNGQQFTQTFIYGTYNGNVTFYEPMVTKAYLDSITSFERPIPQPAAFQKNTYYPTTMRISKHDGVTDIILENFVRPGKN